MNIAVVTPYLDNVEGLNVLARDLQAQSDKRFTWYIIDGGHSPTGQSAALQYPNLSIVFVSLPGSTIYSAINHALLIQKHIEWYAVVGSDDRLYSNYVHACNMAINDSNPYSLVISLPVMSSEKNLIIRSTPNLSIKAGLSSIVSTHSVGCIIHKNSHQLAGLYDQKYFLAADQKFLIELYLMGKSYFYYPQHEAVGEYYLGGSSSTKGNLTLATEMYRVALYFHQNKISSFLVFMFRACKIFLYSR